MAKLFKLFGSIQKVEDNEDGTITVFGIASSGSRDEAGEIIAPDAMKAALPSFQRFPALREMHQPLAAGKVTEAEVDEDGVTHIAALVVDPLAITKVKTGVYSGFSIGGKVTKRDPTDRTIITGLKLVEVSLVDSPCNPDAVLTMWKADTMSDFKPSSEEVIARAKTLAKAAGHQRFKDCLFEASQELISEHLLKSGELEPPASVVEEPAAVVEEPAVVEPVAAVVEEPVAETIEEPVVEPVAEVVDEGDHAGEGNAENDEIEAAAPSNPLAAALEAAINKGNDVVDAAAPAPAEEQPGPFVDLAKAVAALKGITLGEGVIAKGLYSVSRFADLLQSFAYLQESAQCEADYEGDNSPIPAQLAEAIRNLGTILVAMTQEEVAELLADMQGGDVEIIYIGDEIDLANTIVDTVKADTDLMAKAAERVAPPTEDTAEKAALQAENYRLSKAIEDATPAVEQLTKRFEETIDGLKGQITDLTVKFEALDQTPLPPKTAGPAATRTVGKGQDSTGLVTTDDRFAGLSPEQFEKAWNALPEEERGLILVRASLANPHAVATR